MTITITHERVKEVTREDVDRAIDVIERHLEKGCPSPFTRLKRTGLAPVLFFLPVFGSSVSGFRASPFLGDLTRGLRGLGFAAVRSSAGLRGVRSLLGFVRLPGRAFRL